MEGFLVERYWPGVTAEDVRALDARLAALSGGPAEFRASTLVPADEVVLFEFTGRDEAAVRSLADGAGLRCDRLVAVLRSPSRD